MVEAIVVVETVEGMEWNWDGNAFNNACSVCSPNEDNEDDKDDNDDDDAPR